MIPTPLCEALELLAGALHRQPIAEERLHDSLRLEDDPTLAAVLVSIMNGEEPDDVLAEMGLLDE